MKRAIKLLTFIFAVIFISAITIMTLTAYAVPVGILEVKDTNLNQALMLTHVTPHNKDGVVIEFDIISNPYNVAGNTGLYGNELVLFAGMPRNELIPTVSSFNGSLYEGSAVAVNINNNKLSYYPKGYSLYNGNAAFSFNGAGTQEYDWRTTLSSAPYIAGKTIRAIYDFGIRTFKLESKNKGSDDSTYAVIALLSGINNNGGEGFTGSAGIFFDNVGVNIDNFKVKDIDGAYLANQSFNGKIIYPTSAEKIAYGGDTVFSLYDRADNAINTTVDLGGAPSQITIDHIDAGVTGVDSVGAEITLNNTIQSFDYITETFNPYHYITSVTDTTDSINVTDNFEQLSGLTAKVYKDKNEQVTINSEGFYKINYSFTDTAGNNTFTNFILYAFSSLENVNFTGVVSHNSVPITNAEIRYGQNNTVTTDENGVYVISALAGSNLTLNITADGYQPVEVLVEKITSMTIRNIKMIVSDVLYVKGTDETTTIITHKNPHSANGVSYEFDVLQDPDITGNYYSSVVLFAGFKEQTITGYQSYLQFLNESAVYLDVNRQQIVYYPKAMGTYPLTNFKIDDSLSNNGVNTANPTKIIAGYTYKATFNFVNGTFVLERKALNGSVYETKLTMAGIYNAGSGFGGIGLERCGIIIDNFKVYELNGATLANQNYSANIPYTNSEKVFYGGDLVLSVIDASSANSENSVQMNLSSIMMTGLNSDIRNCNGPLMVLNKPDNLKHDSNILFNPYQYIQTISDNEDSLNAESGFNLLDNLNIVYLKNGVTATQLSAEGEYVVCYSYIDNDGNTAYDNFKFEVIIRNITTIELIGKNLPSTMEKDSVFDVTGFKLKINYSIGDPLEIDLLQSMITVDTSVLVEDVLLKISYLNTDLFAFVNIVPKTYLISGVLTSNKTAVEGIKVFYGDGANDYITTDSEGYYSIRVNENTSVTLIVNSTDYQQYSTTIQDISEDISSNISLIAVNNATSSCNSCGSELNYNFAIMGAIILLIFVLMFNRQKNYKK